MIALYEKGENRVHNITFLKIMLSKPTYHIVEGMVINDENMSIRN